MTNTLTRLLLTAALCGLFLLSEAQERNAVSAPDPAAPRMPADSISRDYRLDGVVIGTQRPPSPLGSIAEGRFRLLMRNSSALPRFAGSIDPMRILQLMPGVQTAAEGNSGLYVRGNDAGQNLILLNQAPLYAHAHLLGFFSVFNPGQVASFELSKTGGGRIETAMQPATVVVQSREETGVRWGVEGDLGIIASQATVTAPLTDRAALFLSGRRSYTGWLIGALSPKGEDDLNYRLQDYDATLAWQIDDHNKLIVNSHYGDDRTHITYNEGLLGGRLQWYASVSSATLRSELSPTTHMENALYYSRLDTRLTASTTGISAQAPSSIGDLGYKHSTRWHIGRLQLAAGLQYAYRRIRPQHIASDYGGIADAGRGPRYDTHELAPFLAATIPLTHSLTCDAALRYGFYLLQGDRANRLLPPRLAPAEPLARLAGRTRQPAAGLLQLHHAVHPQSPLVEHQLLHRLLDGADPTHAAAAYPSCGARLLRRSGRRAAQLLGRGLLPAHVPRIGVQRAAHGYGQQPLRTGTVPPFGRRRSLRHGVHGLLRRSEIQRMDQLHAGEIGASIRRPQRRTALPRFARPAARPLACGELHAGRTLGVVDGLRLRFGGAYTPTRDLYIAGGSFVRGHGSYNGARLPDYHRLDLSVTYWLRRKPWRSGINLSLFNLYAHRNPLYISWPVLVDEEKHEYQIHPRRHYLYTVIPSVSWIFKF